MRTASATRPTPSMLAATRMGTAWSERSLSHFLEGGLHHALQAIVDVLGIPEQVLLVLHPLEVRHGNPAGVAQNVRNDEHALLVQNPVGLRSDGPFAASATILAFTWDAFSP